MQNLSSPAIYVVPLEAADLQIMKTMDRNNNNITNAFCSVTTTTTTIVLIPAKTLFSSLPI